MKQITEKYGNVTALQTAAKLRIVNLSSPGSWTQQTINLNVAVLIYDIINSGPGLSALDDELFNLIVKHCLSTQSYKDWMKKLRTALSQSSTYGISKSVTDEGNLYQAASKFWEARNSMSSEDFDPTKAYEKKETKEEWMLKRKLFYQFSIELIAQGTQEQLDYKKTIDEKKGKKDSYKSQC